MKTRKIIVWLAVLATVFSIPDWAVAAKRVLSKEGSKGNKIILEYEFTAPSASKKGEYDLLEMEGLKLYQRPGAPIVPVRPAEVLIPFGKKVVSSKVIASDIHELTGTYRLAPGQEAYPLSYQRVIKPTGPNQAIYGKAKPWPGIDSETMSTQSKRGYQIFVLKLFPLQYIPTTGKVSYAGKLRLEITLADAVEKCILRPTKELKARLSAKFDNSSALATYPETIVRTLDQSQSELLSLPSGDYKYVIITNEDLEEAPGPWNFQALRDSKIVRGITATIVTTEWIYDNYPGITPYPLDDDNDEATKIRNFLIDAYNHWGTEYVLLGGSKNIIPVRYFFVELDDGTLKDIPADMYYGCVEPNECTLDDDADGMYGEPQDGQNGGDVDLCADIYVGRAAVDNSTELSNFIRKTLTYNSTSNDYLTRAAMLGEHIGYGGPIEYGTASMEQIRLGGTYDGYFTHGFGTISTLITEGCLPGYPSRCWPLYDAYGYEWPKEDLIDLMNGGIHIFNHLGHAGEEHAMKLDNYDLSYLTNTDYFFVYSQGCYPGAFDYPRDCFAEVITSMERGAFAVIMNSRHGLGQFYGTDSPSQRFNRQFWDAVLGEGILEIGRANQDSKEDNLYDIDWDKIRWCYYELNLFGDPETRFSFTTRCITFNRDYYSCSDEVQITLSDRNLAGSGNQVVNISTTGGDAEQKTLTEITSGVFEGTILTSGGTVVNYDNTLQLSHGVTISVLYDDLTDDALADCQYPTITNVEYEEIVEYRPAVVTVDTGEPTYANVLCGLSCSGPFDIVKSDGTLSSHHAIELDGLFPYTRYYFKIEVKDQAQNTTVDANNGNCYNFIIEPRDIYVPEDINCIQEAVDRASDGYTIWVAPGIYTGPCNSNIDFSGKAITVRSIDPDNWDDVNATVIDCNGASYSFKFDSNEGSSSVLTGLTIEGATQCGIYCVGTSPTISKCIIRENTARGIDSYEGAPTISNNKIYNNGDVSIYLHSPATGSVISNNLIYDANYGIIIQSLQGTATISNNTIVRNKKRGIAKVFGSGSPTITNCIVWDCNDDLYGCSVTYSCIQDGDSGTGNISSDPCFVSADVNNFHLKEASPCIDAGYPEGNYSGQVDIDNDSRVINQMVDMGADEYGRVYNVNNHRTYGTIGDAMAEASSGDEIVATQGTYYESVTVSDDVTLRSTDPNDPCVTAATIIDGNGVLSPVVDLGRDAVLKGFTIRNGPNCGINCYDADNPIISNCIIEDIGFYGIKHNGCGNNSLPGLTVKNNVIRNNGFAYDNSCGIWVEGGPTTIEENQIYSNHRVGIYAADGSRPIIRNNQIYYHGIAGIYSPCIINKYSTQATIERNRIYNNYDGIDLYYSFATIRNNLFYGNIWGLYALESFVTISNNTLVNTIGIDVKLTVGSGAASIYNCILWNTKGDLSGCGATYSCIKSNVSGEGNIHSDPCFVGANVNDFHIGIRSRCVNRGDPNKHYFSQNDIDSEARVIGSYVDMGADEVNVPVSDAHQWGLDEKTGTTTRDSVGNSKGTFNGDDPCWTDGFIGGAVDFNGVNDYFSVSSLDEAYNNNSFFTVAGWFKTDQSTGIQTIVGQWAQDWGAGQEYYGWQVLVENNKVVARFGHDVDVYDITDTNDVDEGEWYHFAMVRNGTSVVLYVNGQPKATGTANFYTYYTKFRIGDGSYVFNGNPALKGGPFNGMIDDVMLFNRPLSAPEVEQLFDAAL